MKRWMVALVVCTVVGSTGVARAGGYDTPMLYSARHMGMGGTAAAFVSDPSALFHNPAGLAGIKKLSLLADFSLLVGGIQSSPQVPDALNTESEPVIAPFFLVGAGYRITDFLTVGLAVYPVASASAEYKYTTSTGQDVTDSLKLVFIETTLGASFNIDAARLRIGAGYRVTFLNFQRNQNFSGIDSLGFDMKGFGFLGFRAGLQWEAIKHHLQLGFSYRHKTVTKVTQDKLTVPPIFGGTATNGSAEFTLPSRFIWGVRGDYMNIGLALDVEYALGSQNKETNVQGTLSSGDISLLNVFEWDDALTLRVGTEYRLKLGEQTIVPRLGFIYDARVSNKKYPTAFGTPPAPTYVFTLGVGYERGPYQINLAYAYRFGSTTIAKADLADPITNPKTERSCQFCSKEGDYKIWLNGFYVDFSYDFDW